MKVTRLTTSVGFFKKFLKANCLHIDSIEYLQEEKHKLGEEYTQDTYYVHGRIYKRMRHMCPICKRICPRHDTQRDVESKWRAPNVDGAHVYVCYRPDRIECPEHGNKTEYIPWADGGSRFLPSFNNEVAYLALNTSKSLIAEYMDIDWQTVGSCIKATHERLEPDTNIRLRNLVRICMDETSYKKGHKYITVVVNMDNNQVVWVHEGHDNETITKFCELLTPEEQQRIEIVAGDGAKWINYACENYFTNARRCMDPFHVVGWINKALDDVRASVSRQATRQLNEEQERLEKEAERQHQEWLEEYDRYTKFKEELQGMPRRGRRSSRKQELITFIEGFEAAYGETMDLLKKKQKGELTDEQKKRLEQLKEKVTSIKGSKYTLGMNPENLSDCSREKLLLIEAASPDLYEAYKLKEMLRVIIHMTNVELAKESLEDWKNAAEKSKFTSIRALGEKIGRVKEYILNSVQYGANSSKSEQTNGLIKGIIHVAKGFRNLNNMYSLIFLRCSDIVIPLNNRYRPSAEMLKKRREYAAALRAKREEAKRAILA